MKGSNIKNLGERLKFIRDFYGLTSEQIAEFLEIPPDKYKLIEHGGESKISIALLEKLCDLYSVDEDWLIMGEGKFDPNKKYNFLYNYIYN